MNHLMKSLLWDGAVLALGLLAWIGFIGYGSDAGWYISPPMLVLLLMTYIIVFSVIAYWVHKRSVAGLAWEDEHERRRPSLTIPSVSIIVLMIFITVWIVRHQAIWTLH